MKGPFIPALVIAPLMCLGVGLLFGVMAFTRHFVMFGIISGIGIAAGVAMISANVARGWGWHGQKWPD